MIRMKKMSIYDVNPRFFKDETGNGVGDLKGIASKFDYFKYLGTDAINLQDILASHSNNKTKDYVSLDSEIGTVKELSNIIALAKKSNIKIFIEVKIGTITEGHDWIKTVTLEKSKIQNELVEFKSEKEEIIQEGYEAKYSEEAKAYYPVDERTKEIPLNWESNVIVDKFIDIIKFWEKLGISGFVFKDFEFIKDKTKQVSMNQETLKNLRKLYRAIKEVNDNIYVIGKSNNIELKDQNNFTSGATKVFDYFISEKISNNGKSKKYGNDVIGKFSSKKLISDISEIADDSANVIAFGSENTGRFISRWADENQFHGESAKAFALLKHMSPASSTLYFGDEIGARNIGLTHLDDFNDPTLELRKQSSKELNVTEKEFMDAQVLQNPINGKSLMMWNGGKNAGFSTSDKTISPVSVEYKTNNVEIQYKDSDSILNFYRKIFMLIKSPKLGAIIKDGTYKISSIMSLGKVVKINMKLNDKEINVFVNLSESDKKIMGAPKDGTVILSTYSFKEYNSIPKRLQPYEGIVIVPTSMAGSKAQKPKPVVNEEVKVEVPAPKKKEKTQEIVINKADVNKESDKKISKIEMQKNQMKLMEGEIAKSDMTSLTEAQIAPTTQIDIDDMDDIGEFLKNSK